jgi:conjugal transfer/entry exclusion protein
MSNKQKSTEPDKPTEENLVQDLKESLKNTIDETKYILDDLEQTVETTIKDQSISDTTKKIVDSISSEIKNFTSEESQKTINTIKTSKVSNNSEEE